MEKQRWNSQGSIGPGAEEQTRPAARSHPEPPAAASPGLMNRDSGSLRFNTKKYITTLFSDIKSNPKTTFP